MAGQLTIDTLKASTGVLATQNGMTGIAKAWLNYNAVAQTISGSFNVSSVTYIGAGNYVVNFTTALADANYSVIGASNFSTGTSWIAAPYSAGTKTTAAVQIGVVSNNVYTNLSQVSIACFSN